MRSLFMNIINKHNKQATNTNKICCMPKSSVLETQGVTEYGTVGTTKGDGVVSIDLADDGTIIDGLGTVIDGTDGTTKASWGRID